MERTIEGFYCAYFTGRDAMGYAVLVFSKGSIIGADPTGGLFDGSYTEAPGGEYTGNVTVTLPPNGTAVQGVQTGPDGLKYSVSFTLPSGFDTDAFTRVETPLGPVNMKLVYLRGINV